MKPAYLGGVRGYQSAIYRPGTGWSGAESHRHPSRQPAVFKRNQALHVCPLAVARRHRPGLVTKTAIVAVIAGLACFLTLVLSGVTQI